MARQRQSWQKLMAKGAVRVIMYRIVNDLVDRLFTAIEGKTKKKS